MTYKISWEQFTAMYKKDKKKRIAFLASTGLYTKNGRLKKKYR